MLSDAELRHFGTSGWVLKRIFSPEECAALRAAGDAELEARAAAEGTTAAALLRGPDDGPVQSRTLSMHGIIDTLPSEEKPEGAATAVSASVFREVWEDHPSIRAILTQLLGCGPPVFSDASVRMTTPHPGRHDPAARAAARDRTTFTWHRGIRPSWGVRPAQPPAGAVHSSWVNSATFLTDISHGDDGGTFLLSGSHLINDAELDKAQATCVQATAPMGSVLFFTEVRPPSPPTHPATPRPRHPGLRPLLTPPVPLWQALIHCAVDVISDRTRYSMFIACAPPGIRTRVGWRPAAESGVEWSDDLEGRREAVRQFGSRM